MALKDDRPLSGRNVLVMRPIDAADSASELLSARGATPILLPTIVLESADRSPSMLAAARSVEHYDAVAFTSATAVAAFFRALDHVGRDGQALARSLVAAIGPATAESLRAHGVAPDRVAEVQRGEAFAASLLAALTARNGVDGARVLLPRAEVARDAFRDALVAAGVSVDVVVAYVSRPPSAEIVDEIRRRFDEGAIDVVLFTASSIVDNLRVILGGRAVALLARTTVGSIGPITSETCRRHGITVDVEASPYTLNDLVDALERHLAPGMAQRASEGTPKS